MLSGISRHFVRIRQQPSDPAWGNINKTEVKYFTGQHRSQSIRRCTISVGGAFISQSNMKEYSMTACPLNYLGLSFRRSEKLLAQISAHSIALLSSLRLRSVLLGFFFFLLHSTKSTILWCFFFFLFQVIESPYFPPAQSLMVYYSLYSRTCSL